MITLESGVKNTLGHNKRIQVIEMRNPDLDPKRAHDYFDLTTCQVSMVCIPIKTKGDEIVTKFLPEFSIKYSQDIVYKHIRINPNIA